MDQRIFMPGEADVADLAGLPRVEYCVLSAILGENAVGILQANDLMMLKQIDMVGLEPLKGFLDLLGGLFLCTAINLGHEKDLLPISVLERLAHADLANPVMVIPTVVHEGDALINCAPDDVNAFL